MAPTTGRRRLRLQPLGCTVKIGGNSVSQVDADVDERIRRGETFAAAAAAAGYLPPNKSSKAWALCKFFS